MIQFQIFLHTAFLTHSRTVAVLVPDVGIVLLDVGIILSVQQVWCREDT